MKNKYILLIIPAILITTLVVFNLSKGNEDISLLTKLEMENVLSYTLNGNPIDTMPSKNSGYIVKAISCTNGSIITWDNTNWLIEVEKLTTNDLCNIDFTTGVGSNTITITTNYTDSLDSVSKTTTNGGTIEFYAKNGYTIEDVSCASDYTDNKVTFKNVTSSKSCTINLNPSFYDRLLADNPTLSTRTDFSVDYTIDNTGTLYTTNNTEDGSTVYYFAGNAKENWVKFGKDKDDNDLYWRIVRTNEDGSIRLLYHGTSTTSTTAHIGYSSYAVDSETYANPMYVGYMWGTSGSLNNNRTNQTNSSAAKQKIDSWYATSLNEKTDGTYTYDDYVSKTAIYCNDRSTHTAYNMNSTFEYGPFARLSGRDNFEDFNDTNIYQPSYKCGADTTGQLYSTASVADKFTTSNSENIGNELLTYPVALITSDEITFAGGITYGGTSNKIWYYVNSSESYSLDLLGWWTMTPYGYRTTADNGALIGVVSNQNTNHGDSRVSIYNNALRPVISLKSCVSWQSGKGSANEPYQVSINSTCAEKDN